MSDLFDWAERSRRSDPKTSRDSARRVREFDRAHYGKILVALAGGRKATIYEIANETGLSHVQVARRMPEMRKLGLAELTGETRPSPAGRLCRLWRVIEDA